MLKPARNLFEIEVANTQANQMFEESRPSGVLGKLCHVKSVYRGATKELP